MKAAGRLAGVFTEPVAATAVAGVKRAISDGVIDRRADVLAVITGHGLKDILAAMNAAGEPVEVAPLAM